MQRDGGRPRLPVVEATWHQYRRSSLARPGHNGPRPHGMPESSRTAAKESAPRLSYRTSLTKVRSLLRRPSTKSCPPEPKKAQKPLGPPRPRAGVLLRLVDSHRRDSLGMSTPMTAAVGIPIASMMRHRPEQYGYYPECKAPNGTAAQRASQADLSQDFAAESRWPVSSWAPSSRGSYSTLLAAIPSHSWGFQDPQMSRWCCCFSPSRLSDGRGRNRGPHGRAFASAHPLTPAVGPHILTSQAPSRIESAFLWIPPRPAVAIPLY